MAGIDDETKRRVARKLRRRRRSAVQLGQQADQQIERLLIRRFGHLASVRRFVALWVLLFLVLILAGIYQLLGLSAYYQELRPVPGGIYTEGVIGNFTDANPLYATGAADTAVSRLVFSGLFKYDSHNRLVGDLAQSYNLLGTQQTRYIVHLKHGLKWQDGKPLTADDVVFTYQTIQNLDAQSPLYSSWNGIKVTKQDNYTVVFDLPNALSDFPYSMTNGIIPYHLLSKTTPADLRSAPFNTQPVGTGPFEWKFIEVTGNSTTNRQQRISLAAFDGYAGGRAKHDGFNLITYNDENQMMAAFNAKQISAMSGLDTIPASLKNDKSVQIHVTPLTTAVMVFFKTTEAPFTDKSIRQALVLAVDRSQLQGLFDSPVELVDSPLLKDQLGYNKKYAEPAFNLAAAKKILAADGWTAGSNGVLSKNGQPLTFTLTAPDTPDYTKTAQFLQAEWQQIGVKLQVNYYENEDLQTSVVADHNYQALLDGISIGVDPDVFAYWDSSQAPITSAGHLNLSEYNSPDADRAVEAGRTRSDPKVRTFKYAQFQSQWRKDLPALALYQPNYLYITRGQVFNYNRSADNAAADRFDNVSNWMIRQKRVTTH